MVCLDARHTKKALNMKVNKTDVAYLCAKPRRIRAVDASGMTLKQNG